MNLYKSMAKEYLQSHVKMKRWEMGVTQEKMAEYLRIACRSYSDLESGRYCCSATSLLFFLLMLTENEVKDMIDEFREMVFQIENNAA